MHTKFEFKNSEVKRHLDDLNLSGRGICIKIVFFFVYMWRGIGISNGLCKHDDEPSALIKGKKFIVQLNEY